MLSKSQTVKTTALTTSMLFVASLLIPVAVSAKAPTTTGTKVNVAMLSNNKATCVANVSKVDTKNLAKLKAFGEKRFDKRQQLLQKYKDSKIVAKYAATERNKSKKEENTVKIADKLGIRTWGAQPVRNAVQLKKGSLIEEVSMTLGAVNNLKGSFNAAKTPAQVADPLCTLVYDQKVFSYFNNKIQQQNRIDNLNVSLGENYARLVNYRKAAQHNNDAKNLKALDAALVKNKQLQDQLIGGYQASLYKITKESLPQAQQNGSTVKSTQAFNAIWGGQNGYKQFTVTVKQHTKQVDSFKNKIKKNTT